MEDHPGQHMFRQDGGWWWMDRRHRRQPPLIGPMVRIEEEWWWVMDGDVWGIWRGGDAGGWGIGWC